MDDFLPSQESNAQPALSPATHDTVVTAHSADAQPVEVIARAVDICGKSPRLVLEGRNHLDQRVRYLLPEQHASSKQRVISALVGAGFACGTPAQTRLIAERVMAASPPGLAMYSDHEGWQNSHTVFVLADKICTETRAFPRFMDGSVETPIDGGNLAAHLSALKAFNDPAEVAAVGAVLAGILAPLVGQRPFMVALSGMAAEEADRARSLASSIFSTSCNSVQVTQIDTAAEAAPVVELVKPTAANKGTGLHRHVRSRAVNASTERFIVATVAGPALDDLNKMLTVNELLVIPANGRRNVDAADSGIVAQDALHQYHGALGGAYVEQLVRLRGSVLKNAAELIPRSCGEYAKQLGLTSDDAAATQLLTHLALLRFAFTFALKFELCPWTKEQVDLAMRVIAARCHDHHLKRKRAFEREVIDALKAEATSCEKTVKGRKLLHFSTADFDKRIVGGRDKSAVLAFLIERKCLVTTKGNPTQLQVRGLNPANPDERKWVYAIDAAILNRS